MRPRSPARARSRWSRPDRPSARPPVAADDVFVAPEGDPTAFAAMVGRYAASIDAGREPGDALRAATAGTGWAPALDEAAGSNPGG